MSAALLQRSRLPPSPAGRSRCNVPGGPCSRSLVLAFASWASSASRRSPMPSARPAAAVGWPVSTALLVAEVVTGGASASDEYVEIVNAGATVGRSPGRGAGVRLAARHVRHAQGRPGRRRGRCAGPAPPGGQRGGTFARIADATWSERHRRDRRGCRAARDRRRGDRRRRLGRRHQRVRRGKPAPAPASLLEHRAAARRRGRQLDGHERQRGGFRRSAGCRSPRNLASPADPPAASPSRPPSATPHPTAAGATDALGLRPRRTPTASAEPPDASATPSETPRRRPTRRVLVGAAGDRDHRALLSPALRRRPRLSQRRPTRRRRRRSHRASDARADPRTDARADPGTDARADPRTDARADPEPTPSRPRADARADPEPTARQSSRRPPTPAPVTPIAIARAADLDTVVTIEGVLTTALGGVRRRPRARSSRTTARGSASTSTPPVPRRSREPRTSASPGTIDERYAQRCCASREADIIELGGSGLPPAGGADDRRCRRGRSKAPCVDGGAARDSRAIGRRGRRQLHDRRRQRRRCGSLPRQRRPDSHTGVVVRATGPLGQRDSRRHRAGWLSRLRT